jgi:hypothetical protein
MFMPSACPSPGVVFRHDHRFCCVIPAAATHLTRLPREEQEMSSTAFDLDAFDEETDQMEKQVAERRRFSQETRDKLTEFSSGSPSASPGNHGCNPAPHRQSDLHLRFPSERHDRKK